MQRARIFRVGGLPTPRIRSGQHFTTSACLKMRELQLPEFTRSTFSSISATLRRGGLQLPSRDGWGILGIGCSRILRDAELEKNALARCLGRPRRIR